MNLESVAANWRIENEGLRLKDWRIEKCLEVDGYQRKGWQGLDDLELFFYFFPFLWWKMA